MSVLFNCFYCLKGGYKFCIEGFNVLSLNKVCNSLTILQLTATSCTASHVMDTVGSEVKNKFREKAVYLHAH